MPLGPHPTDTIIFEASTDARYIWPLDRCRSFDEVKLLIYEVYSQLDDSWSLEQVREGDYTIRTESGAIILPSVWDSVVKPDLVIQIGFQSVRGASRVPAYDRSLELITYRPPFSDEGFRPARLVPSPISEHNIAVDIGDGDDKSSSSDFGSDLSSVASEEELSDNQTSPGLEEEPQRIISTPTDLEGNKLSFKVNTTLNRPLARPDKAPGSDGAEPEGFTSQQHTRGTTSEHMRIMKAISTQVEGRSMVQVYTFSGPDSALAHSSTSIIWYHLHSERLDYARFKEVCLGVPGLSVRLQKLTKVLLEKVEKEHVDALLEGMFIKPGTVLRGDESHQSDPQTAIFSCVPYFELQPAVKRGSTTGQVNRLFPPRTLMQSYYPYEPVRERDEEQAYRKFGNENPKALIHVPNLWVLNIADRFVVTCGHQPLSKDFVKSIETVPVDLALSQKSRDDNIDSSIRLTDRIGRQLFFSPRECRSYFQMEQKLREIETICCWTGNPTINDSLQLAWNRSDSKRELVTPEIWSTIIRSNNSLFIDLVSLDMQQAKDLKSKTVPTKTSASSLGRVPHIFHWPQESKYEQSLEKDGPDNTMSIEEKRSMRCLELAGKAMLTEILETYAVNSVDRSFSSTEFYQKLPEESYGNVEASIASLRLHEAKHRNTSESTTYHHILIQAQRNMIAEKTYKFQEVVHTTMRLYVPDLDKSVILRKLWAAMSSICKTSIAFEQLDTSGFNLEDYPGVYGRRRSRPLNAWYIRSISSGQSMPMPAANDEFRQSIRKCKRCRHNHAYNDLQSAKNHLQKHFESIPPPSSTEAPIQVHTYLTPANKGTTLSRKPSTQFSQPKLENTSSKQDAIGTHVQPEFQDWIVSSAQKRCEEWNEGAIAILAKACEAGQKILDEAKDLVSGVCNEDGAMSGVYTFPRALLAAFRQIIVFYLAVERALHYTEQLYQEKSTSVDDYEVPFSAEGLQVLEKFSNGAQHSLALARRELCRMARSDQPIDDIGRLSLGPEYLCSWFMRRLLVKPLEKSMTVSDMYREYLSTIQFQVNHRPGKRLLRSINLLQEELIVLLEVNRWQTKLVSNYMSVLNDSTYEKDIPSRRAMYPYEDQLLTSCLEHLSLTREDYVDQIRRCGPLSESTKQSLEINEEDHGKAIMIFTIVTIIFLPLSFVTSYLGMNTSDIRDMESRQSLFWSIAIPLTAVTMGSILFISYNGDELRDSISASYRTLTGKQDRSTTARGISVAQRKRARKLANITESLDYGSLADEAEYMDPRADGRPSAYITAEAEDEVYTKIPCSVRLPTAAKYDDARAGSKSPSPPPPPPVEPRCKQIRVKPEPFVDRLYSRPAVARRPSFLRPQANADVPVPVGYGGSHRLNASRPQAVRYTAPAPRYIPPAPIYPRHAQHAQSQTYPNRADYTRQYNEWDFYPPPPPVEDMPRYDWAKKGHARDGHRGGRHVWREDNPR